MISLYISTDLDNFLEETVYSVVRKHLSHRESPIEVNPLKLEDSSELKSNQTQLLQITTEIVSNVAEKTSQLNS